VLIYSTNHQHIPCGNEELCDDASIVYVRELMKEIDIVVFETTTCTKNGIFVPITSAHDELKVLSSLNTLGYIKFDVLYNLNNLEEKLSFCTDLLWISKHTYHFIGRYNWKRKIYDTSSIYLFKYELSFVMKNMIN
jgi:hypothetical protein